MRRAVILLILTGLTGCAGETTPVARLTGNCSAVKHLSFAPLSPATVQAALGPVPVTYAGLVFPGKRSPVPDAGDCAYYHDVEGPRLTVALDRKTDFFRSYTESRRYPRTHKDAKPIAGLDGYTVRRGDATWAVVNESRRRIVWAQLKAKTPPADATAITVTAVRQAVRSFHVPMTAQP